MSGKSEIKKVAGVIDGVIANEQIPDPVKREIISLINNYDAPLMTDPWIYRIVVLSLGLTVLGTVLGGFFLVSTSAAAMPEGLIALGSAAVGALAGLLAPSPRD